MDELDLELRSLMTTVHQHPQPGPERRKALHRLLRRVQNLPGILKSPHQNYPEALNRTWEWVCKNIDQFQVGPDFSSAQLVKWLNGYLCWRIRDLYPDDNRYVSMDAFYAFGEDLEHTLADRIYDRDGQPRIFNSAQGIWGTNLVDQLIEQIHSTEQQRLAEKLIEYIKQDPDERLRSCHPRQYPNCNAQFLTLRLLLQAPPIRLVDISREHQINYQALNSHWKRKCLPLLQAIAQEFSAH
jgi:hypothetical protein